MVTPALWIQCSHVLISGIVWRPQLCTASAHNKDDVIQPPILFAIAATLHAGYKKGFLAEVIAI